MERMLLLGIVVAVATTLSCPAAWANPVSSTSPGVMHAANANLGLMNGSTDYSSRWRRTSNFNPGLNRPQAVLCHVQSTFGTDTSGTITPGMAAPRPIEIVYVARIGSACGIPPFYGFGFIYPVNP